MQRFWILLRTELKTWRQDPITALAGLIPPTILLVAFGLLFSGELSFPIAVLNHDRGTVGALLVDTFDQVLSPFDQPYYRVLDLTEPEAWAAFEAQRIDAVWVIPADFSARLEAGQHPEAEMHYNNYIDDRAKNHRLYAAEILWHFYQRVSAARHDAWPAPPLETAEVYPLPEMVDWFSIIGTGTVLMGVTLGAMINIFMLTYKEQVSQITLEFGACPRSLVEILLPKVVLALAMGLLTGTVLLGILYVWAGIWPGPYLGTVYLLSGLVALFWISLALVLGLRARHYFAAVVACILSGIIAFFLAGGLSPVRYYPRGVQWIARLFPNSYAIDPLRDLMLFHRWPSDWTSTLLVVAAFALVGLGASFAFTDRQLRRLG